MHCSMRESERENVIVFQHRHPLRAVCSAQHRSEECFYAVGFSSHSRLSLTTRRDAFDAYNVCVLRGENARTMKGPIGKK